MSLTIDDLRLCGSEEDFYLLEGEIVLWIRDNGDGTALVRTRASDGFENVTDAELKDR